MSRKLAAVAAQACIEASGIQPLLPPGVNLYEDDPIDVNLQIRIQHDFE